MIRIYKTASTVLNGKIDIRKIKTTVCNHDNFLECR